MGKLTTYARPSQDGLTPLHLAAESSLASVKMVKLLLEPLGFSNGKHQKKRIVYGGKYPVVPRGKYPAL